MQYNITAGATYELKATEFKPEHVGKLNFYLSVVDGQLKSPGDNPSIGLLLCKKKSKLIAEYALKRTDGPIGVAEYKLLQELPKELRNELPSTQVLETELSKDELLEKDLTAQNSNKYES